MKKIFYTFPLAVLISGCSTTSPNHNSNDVGLKAVEISSKEINVSTIAGKNSTASESVIHDFKFPLTVSCLLKNKSDSNIMVVGILIVEKQRATMSGTNLFNYNKISNGVYKLSAIFSTTTLDINSMTISGTGANSNLFGECRPLN